MDLSRTVSERDGDFSQKSQKIFPHPCILHERAAAKHAIYHVESRE